MLHDKGGLENHFLDYIGSIERHTKMKVGRINTDNAPEFLPIRKRLESMSINLINSSPHTPEPNALVERKYRKLLDKACSMLEYAGLPIRYCGDAIKHTEDLHNQTVTKALNMRTSMEALLGTIPDNTRLRVFGCAAYPHIYKKVRADKFAHRAEKGIYLGNFDQTWIL